MGIVDVEVEVFLECKSEVVICFCKEGCIVVMVGDGVNDVLVFVVVDVGIVMGGGMDVVMEFVGVMLLGGDLLGIVKVCCLLGVIMCNIW